MIYSSTHMFSDFFLTGLQIVPWCHIDMIENHRSLQTSFGRQSAGHRKKNESETKWTNISCKLLNTIYLFSTLSLSHPCFKYFPSSTGAWITRLQIQGRTVFFWLSWVIRLLLFSVGQKVSSLKQATEKYSAMGRTSSRGSMTFFLYILHVLQL